MSGKHNKNLLFFSYYNEDKLSKECLSLISENEKLKNQFIILPIHDMHDIFKPPPYKLPKDVIEAQNRNLLPVLFLSGFKKCVIGKNAQLYLKNSLEKEKNGGLDYAAIGSMADNCSTIEQLDTIDNEFFNTGYNCPFSDGRGEIGKQYANIEESESQMIETIDVDIKSDKKIANLEIQKKFEEQQKYRNENGNQNERRGYINPSENRRMNTGLPPIMPQPQMKNINSPFMPNGSQHSNINRALDTQSNFSRSYDNQSTFSRGSNPSNPSNQGHQGHQGGIRKDNKNMPIMPDRSNRLQEQFTPINNNNQYRPRNIQHNY